MPIEAAGELRARRCRKTQTHPLRSKSSITKGGLGPDRMPQVGLQMDPVAGRRFHGLISEGQDGFSSKDMKDGGVLDDVCSLSFLGPRQKPKTHRFQLGPIEGWFARGCHRPGGSALAARSAM
jgi:hypothetical protein